MTVGQRRPDRTRDTQRPGNDYRVLQPALLTDPNRNRTAVAIDTLGMVVATAAMGKAGNNEGDIIDASYITDLDDDVVAAHLADPLADPAAVLGTASTRLIYDLNAYLNSKDDPQPRPPVVYTIARESHVADLSPGQQTRVQHTFSYFDGFGREIQKKVQAEPAPNGEPRWVGSGWTIFNNKGNPVRTYEPFFSTTPAFEFGVAVGASSVLFYDPVDRVIATIHPNDTYEKVTFGPWHQTSFDVNDTVVRDPRNDADIAAHTAGFFASADNAGWSTWYAQRINGDLGQPERDAASRAAAHQDTPTTTHFDTLGRAVRTVVDNGVDPQHPDRHLLFTTRFMLDIEGNQRAVRDAAASGDDDVGRLVMHYDHDMLGSRIAQRSMEAGGRWTLTDVAGKPIRIWDSRAHTTRIEYDQSRRPMRTWVTGADPDHPNVEVLTDLLVYGEQVGEAIANNLRTKVVMQLDQAGLSSTNAYDFKGGPRQSTRRVTSGTQFRTTVDWRALAVPSVIPADPTTQIDDAVLQAALAERLEADAYVSTVQYDALDRPREITTPHTSSMTPNVLRHRFNEAGLLEGVDALLRPAAGAPPPTQATPFVTDIDYNAKGQRTKIEYSNEVITQYSYDPRTSRLTRLRSTRPGAAGSRESIQDCSYTFDPVGNITHIEDAAQQTVIFKNRVVTPSCDYTYDALYRLADATGREHLGQSGTPVPHSWNDATRTGIVSSDGAGGYAPGDGQAMGRYAEHYMYDAVGNILQMAHRRLEPANAGWTRTFAYTETSLLEDGHDGSAARVNNRLTSTTLGGAAPVEAYHHDAHGNMVRMPHLGGSDPAPNLWWNHHDQIARVDKGGGGTAYHVYDASGERTRKVWEKTAGLVEEHLYLNGFEIYRRRQGQDLLVRETLHVVDAKQRIALVETRTVDTANKDKAPAQLIRYQLGNRLGSVSLEVDQAHEIVTYEEYSPYGSTTYQAVRSATDLPKRYRYTGKERDEETGLFYHGARFYAPWLGRWASADPIGLEAGPNIFVYCRDNPITYADRDGRTPENGYPEQPQIVVSGPYRALPTLPDFTREHVMATNLLEKYFLQSYGAAATQALKGPMRDRANTVLWPNAWADPKTVRDKADAAGARKIMSGGEEFMPTDIYLRGMRNAGAGGRLSPETKAVLHDSAVRQLVPYVKAEKYAPGIAAGGARPKDLSTALAPGGQAPAAQDGATRVPVTVFPKPGGDRDAVGDRDLPTRATAPKTPWAGTLMAGIAAMLPAAIGLISTAGAENSAANAWAMQAERIENLRTASTGVLIVTNFRHTLQGDPTAGVETTGFVSLYPIPGFATEAAARKWVEGQSTMAANYGPFSRVKATSSWIPPLNHTTR